MHSIIYIFSLRKFRIYFTIFFLCFSTLVQAQTYSSEEIVISGLGFARFSVALVPEKSFTDHMDAKRWLRIIDRNLCWSGVFLVTDSRYKTCRTAAGNQVDMKIMLKLKGTVTDNSDLVPKHLMLTVADNDGVPLFPLELPIRKNRFREAELMDLINEIRQIYDNFGYQTPESIRRRKEKLLQELIHTGKSWRLFRGTNISTYCQVGVRKAMPLFTRH